MSNKSIDELNRSILETTQKNIEYEQVSRRIPITIASLLLSLASLFIFLSIFHSEDLAIQQVLVAIAGIFIIFALNTFKSFEQNSKLSSAIPFVKLDNRTFVYGNYNSQESTSSLSSEQQEYLLEIAAEIQKLLNHISETYPANTTQEKIITAAKVVSEIENNHTLKQKIVSAVRTGSISAIETMITHPAGAITLAALVSWQSEQENKEKVN